MSKYTKLEMRQAHEQGHVGVKETIIKFRTVGFWTTCAGKLTKKVKGDCIICHYLDLNPISQQMGLRGKELSMKPGAWKQVEMDLMGHLSVIVMLTRGLQ